MLSNQKLIISLFLTTFILLLINSINEKTSIGVCMIHILSILYDITIVMVTMEFAPYFYDYLNIH